MSEQNKMIVQRYVAEVSNRRNRAAIDELIAVDYLHHADGGVSFDLRGPALIQREVAALTAAFANPHWTIEDLIAEEDKVVYRWTARGVHQGEFMGIAATGKPVSLTGITILRIESGKIAERWGSADMAGLLQQLAL